MERNESDEEAEGQQPEIRIRICGYSGQLSDYLVDAVRWDQVDVAQGLMEMIREGIGLQQEALAEVLVHYEGESCNEQSLRRWSDLDLHEVASMDRTLCMHVGPALSDSDEKSDSDASLYMVNSVSRQTDKQKRASTTVAPATSETEDASNQPLSRDIPKSAQKHGKSDISAPRSKNIVDSTGSDPHDDSCINFTFERQKWVKNDVWQDASPAERDEISWASCCLMARRNTLFSDLEEIIKSIIKKKIDGNEHLRAAGERRKLQAPFWATTQLIQRPGVWVSVSDGKFNVRTIQDLLVHPNHVLILHVHVVFDIKLLRQSLKEDVQPIWQTPLQPQLVRLGNVVHATSKKRMKGQHDVGDPDRPYYARREGAIQTPTLHSIHAFDFGDFCIGDGLSVQAHCDFDFSRHDLLGPFGKVENKEQLYWAIAVFLNQELPPQIGSGAPFIPPYCFNQIDNSNFHETDFGIKNAFLASDQEVKVYVRCVGHIRYVNDLGTVTDLMAFPEGLKLEMAATSTTRNVRISIESRLRQFKPPGTVPLLNETSSRSRAIYSSAALYHKPLAGTWVAELWICPQMFDVPNDARRMYRFSEAEGQQESIALSRFLHKKSWEKGDRRLYVEIHILPKYSSNWSITGSIVYQAPELRDRAGTLDNKAGVSGNGPNYDDENNQEGDEEKEEETEDEDEDENVLAENEDEEEGQVED
ncbi:unnamed protein product [Cercospora beticola]|nr:unnamed protein product [Cercospora beticola]